jgi:hypothetical protein
MSILSTGNVTCSFGGGGGGGGGGCSCDVSLQNIMEKFDNFFESL